MEPEKEAIAAGRQVIVLLGKHQGVSEWIELAAGDAILKAENSGFS